MAPDTPLGKISISSGVLADLAGYSALECYGIVGMAAASAPAAVVQLLSRDKLRKGVTIATDDGEVRVGLYVVVEYGTNIAEVVHNSIERVRYVLETYAEVDVADIEVHVQGIKVRD